jgi:hypothetical protein
LSVRSLLQQRLSISVVRSWMAPDNVCLIVTALLYVLSFPYHAAMRSPNELSRLWLTRSLVEHHSLAINQALETYGRVGDLSCTLTVADGSGIRLHPCIEAVPPGATVLARRYYSSKAPLLSFLAVPVYAVLKALGRTGELMEVFCGRLFLCVMPTLVMLIFLRRFLRVYLQPPTVALMLPVYALGTMAFSYAESFMSHQLTAVLVFGTLYFAFNALRSKRRQFAFVGAGACAGATVACEYTGVIFVLAVAVYVLLSLWAQKAKLLQAMVLVLLGGAPFLLGLMAYHQSCFGGPFISGYKFLDDAAYQPWHLGGFLGIRFPDPRAFALSFFSPLRGLFTLSPVLLLTFWGLGTLKVKDRALFWATNFAMLGSAYFTSSFSYDSWGWTVGPRHLTGLLPLLMLPVGFAFERPGAPVRLGIFAGTAVTSVAASVLVSVPNYIPPELSTSIFGLAVPLLLSGHFPVTVLAAFLPNPTSGLIWLALAAIAVLTLWQQLRRIGAPTAVVLVTVVLHFGALQLLTRNDAADKGALGFVQSVWGAPNGMVLKF